MRTVVTHCADEETEAREASEHAQDRHPSGATLLTIRPLSSTGYCSDLSESKLLGAGPPA